MLQQHACADPMHGACAHCTNVQSQLPIAYARTCMLHCTPQNAHSEQLVIFLAWYIYIHLVYATLRILHKPAGMEGAHLQKHSSAHGGSPGDRLFAYIIMWAALTTAGHRTIIESDDPAT